MTTVIQRRFHGGEIDPRFAARLDAEKVQAGLATCRNFFVEKSGTVANRAGTKEIGFTKNAVNPSKGTFFSRLIPSIRDLTTTYLLELGFEYIRIWKNGVPLSIVGTVHPYVASQYSTPGTMLSSFGSTWYATAEPLNTTATTITVTPSGPNYLLTASSAIFTSGMVGNQFTVHDSGGNFVTFVVGTFTDSTHIISSGISMAPPNTLLNIPTTTWSTSLTPVAGPYWYLVPTTQFELPTPYDDNDLQAIHWTQSVDTITFTHPNYPTYELSRFNDTTWTFKTVVTTPAVGAPTGCIAIAGLPVAGTIPPAVGSLVASAGGGTVLCSWSVIPISTNAQGAIATSASHLGGSSGTPAVITWTAASGATAYAIYRHDPTTPAGYLIGVATGLTFSDAGELILPFLLMPAAVGTLSTIYTYQVTAVDVNGNESAASASFSCTGQTAWLTTNPTGTPNNVLGWNPVAGAVSYNVYRERVAGSGILGYIGTASNLNGFNDNAILPDTGSQPPMVRTLFATANNYPSTAAYFQQRYCFACTITDPQGVSMSRTGSFHDFSSYFPSEDTDAIIFDVDGDKTNPIRHMLDLGTLLLFTDNGIYSCQGGNGGALTPENVNVHKENSLGCSALLQPILVNNSAIYLQSRGSIVRDVKFDLYTNGYNGADLSNYSAHLVNGYQLVSWCFAEAPLSMLWIVRSDGTLLTCTYIPEQQIVGWAHHDTIGGQFCDVCSLPQATQTNSIEDTVYAIVLRTVNGVPKRMIEQVQTRLIQDPLSDTFFVDSGLKYDGRNTTSETMTLTSSNYSTYTQVVNLTRSSGAPFPNGVYVLRDAVGNKITFTQNSIVGSGTVTGYTDQLIPPTLQGVPVTTWSACTNAMTLPLIPVSQISVLADGNVISWPDPNGETVPLMTDVNGLVALGGWFEVVIAGLPITADLQTQDIENPQPFQTWMGREKTVQKIIVRTDTTRGIMAGEAFDNLSLEEPPPRDVKTGYDMPNGYANEFVDAQIRSSFHRKLQLCIREQRPLPFRLLAIAGVLTLGSDN